MTNRLARSASITGALLALAAPGVADSQLTSAPRAHVVTVSPPANEEPTIAVNPSDPSQVVAAFQGMMGTAERAIGVAYSRDSGRTFALATGLARTGFRVAGDVTLAFDNHGIVYLSYIGADKFGSDYYAGHGSGHNAVVVRRSLDGGKSWEPDGSRVREPPVSANTPFQDMERLFADAGPRSPYAGNVYIGWIEWQLTQSVMLFSRSTDSGRTWSPAMRISTHAGLPRDGNGDVVGFNGTVGGDGTLYTVWHDGTHIAFTTSRDGGKTFAPSRWIIETGPPYIGPPPDVGPVFGAMGFPQVGVDPRDSTLYVCWSDYTNGDIDVFLARSVDGGRTWSRKMRVNTNPIHDGTDQFLQWMKVDPVTGAIYVQFYDRRADTTDRKTMVTLARSTDHGRTFVNYAWTDKPFDGHDVRLGDYMWLTAYGNRVYGVWAEVVAADSTPGAGGASPTRFVPVIRVGTADFAGR